MQKVRLKSPRFLFLCVFLFCFVIITFWGRGPRNVTRDDLCVPVPLPSSCLCCAEIETSKKIQILESEEPKSNLHSVVDWDVISGKSGLQYELWKIISSKKLKEDHSQHPVQTSGRTGGRLQQLCVALGSLCVHS